MTVRELIAQLSECDLNATVEVEWNFIVDDMTTDIKVVTHRDADGAPFVRIVSD